MSTRFSIPPAFHKYVRITWIIIISPVLLLFTLVAATAFGLFGTLPTFEELENEQTDDVEIQEVEEK